MPLVKMTVIAIVIAGVLAAIAVPRYHAMTDRVREAATLDKLSEALAER